MRWWAATSSAQAASSPGATLDKGGLAAVDFRPTDGPGVFHQFSE
jgi:hypothetical protein